ncbi:hypothetical protein M0805_004942 [Coniferiporia weirii]|nr:hypothetical protein M0805_004942 [Coniferiporia weirii]
MLFDFGDLDLADEGPSLDRKDRIRFAFEKSKQSYVNERVITEPRWYDQSEVPAPTKSQIRDTDYSLNNLYLRREYAQLLPLVLTQLELTEANSKGDKRNYQLTDLAIRCALKLGENDCAGQLADKTARKWSANVGLAVLCTEVYLACSRPRDALSAILTAIAQRGSFPPYKLLLYRSLQGLAGELGSLSALETILRIVQPQIETQATAPTDYALDEAKAMELAGACGIIGSDQERLAAILCHKTSTDEESNEEKGVRTL